MHVWYSHRYAYSPLVTEPNDYGKSSVFGWQWTTAVHLMICIDILSTVFIHSPVIYISNLLRELVHTNTVCSVQY